MPGALRRPFPIPEIDLDILEEEKIKPKKGPKPSGVGPAKTRAPAKPKIKPTAANLIAADPNGMIFSADWQREIIAKHMVLHEDKEYKSHQHLIPDIGAAYNLFADYADTKEFSHPGLKAPFHNVNYVTVMCAYNKINGIGITVDDTGKETLVLYSSDDGFASSLAEFSTNVNTPERLLNFVLWLIYSYRIWRGNNFIINYINHESTNNKLSVNLCQMFEAGTNNLYYSLKKMFEEKGMGVTILCDTKNVRTEALVKNPLPNSLVHFVQTLDTNKSKPFTLRHAKYIASHAETHLRNELREANKTVSKLLQTYVEAVREQARLRRYLSGNEEMINDLVVGIEETSKHSLVKQISVSGRGAIRILSDHLLIDLASLPNRTINGKERFCYIGYCEARIDLVRSTFSVWYPDGNKVSPNNWCMGNYDTLMAQALSTYQIFDLLNLLMNHVLVRDGNTHASFHRYKKFPTREAFDAWIKDQPVLPCNDHFDIIGRSNEEKETELLGMAALLEKGLDEYGVLNESIRIRDEDKDGEVEDGEEEED